MPAFGNRGGGPGKWEPSVVYLLALVLIEITVMAGLRTFTKHGG